MHAGDTAVRLAGTLALMKRILFAGVQVVCVYIPVYLLKCSVLISCATS